MAEILHQLIGSLSHYLRGFIHPRWCRISAINSSRGWNNPSKSHWFPTKKYSGPITPVITIGPGPILKVTVRPWKLMVDSIPFGGQPIFRGYGSFGDGCSDHLCSSNPRDGMMEWFTFFNFPPPNWNLCDLLRGSLFRPRKEWMPLSYMLICFIRTAEPEDHPSKIEYHALKALFCIFQQLLFKGCIVFNILGHSYSNS